MPYRIAIKSAAFSSGFFFLAAASNAFALVATALVAIAPLAAFAFAAGTWLTRVGAIRFLGFADMDDFEFE
jgi:hypothetical protein